MFQNILSIQDKRFNLSQLSQYCLLMSLGSNSLRICCIEQATARCLLLESYQLEEQWNNVNDYLEALKQFFKKRTFVGNNDWKKVVVFYENQKYTLVPTALFDAHSRIDYLNLVTCNAGNITQYCTHNSLGITVIFGANPLIVNYLQNTYQQITKYYQAHQANSLIAGSIFYLNAKNEDKAPIVIVFSDKIHLHISVTAHTNLLYYNRFAYSTSDEFLQYILIVMHALALEPTKTPVILAGNVIKHSLTHKKMLNYIRYVSFSTPTSYLKFSWRFKNDILIHFFDMLNFYPTIDYLDKGDFTTAQ